MAKKSASLENKRAYAKQRLAAANRKIRRIERSGVKIAGSQFDPRRENAKINSYTAKQVDTYVSQLNKFVDRKTQFVGDVHGTPIAARTWREYKKRENKVNRKINESFEKIKNIPMPNTTQTIGEHMEATAAKFKTAGRSANSPFRPPERKPSNMAGEDKLREFTKKLDDKLRIKDGKDFLQRDLETDRDVVRQMSEALNMPEIYAETQKLSDAQFNVLFNFWGFADRLSLPYHLHKEDAETGADIAWHEKKLKSNLKHAVGLIGDAKNLKLDS